MTQRIQANGRPTPGYTGRRQFVLPAFELPLEVFVRLARAQTGALGATGEVPHEPVRGGVLATQDALVLARHLVLGEEIGKPDVLASIEVAIDPVSWRLAATPFERHQKGLRCAVTGTVI